MDWKNPKLHPKWRPHFGCQEWGNALSSIFSHYSNMFEISLVRCSLSSSSSNFVLCAKSHNYESWRPPSLCIFLLIKVQNPDFRLMRVLISSIWPINLKNIRKEKVLTGVFRVFGARKIFVWIPRSRALLKPKLSEILREYWGIWYFWMQRPIWSFC